MVVVGVGVRRKKRLRGGGKSGGTTRDYRRQNGLNSHRFVLEVTH
ncbi:hypothetical protein HanXRQr2_Chr03g0109901 [Helianthus annuus]|uniref:Uncharacterized protein n=1 Tax=Helianthus annuus TaxID=4232 RepID=A0A9K3JFR3_HELAN|nr:hypothetical protein HanXRQr2_Chr03g0109901 [Helianthus annuus]